MTNNNDPKRRTGKYSMLVHSCYAACTMIGVMLPSYT